MVGQMVGVKKTMSQSEPIREIVRTGPWDLVIIFCRPSLNSACHSLCILSIIYSLSFSCYGNSFLSIFHSLLLTSHCVTGQVSTDQTHSRSGRWLEVCTWTAGQFHSRLCRCSQIFRLKGEKSYVDVICKSKMTKVLKQICGNIKHWHTVMEINHIVPTHANNNLFL